MSRPVRPLSTYGAISVRRTEAGRYVAGARYRDDDGAYSRITATGITRQGAINALKEKIADHQADGGGELNPATTLTALAEFWLAEVRTSEALGEVSGEHPLFSTRNGTFITPNNFRRQLRAILAAAHLPDGLDLDALPPRVLRKTVATAIDGGASAALAAELLGHSSTGITETFYIQPTTRMDAATAGILERLAPADTDSGLRQSPTLW